MRRKILAIIVFNVYTIFFISAFQENTGYLFDINIIDGMKLNGIPGNPSDLGWGSHYIWRLFAGVVVTVIVGFLTGAVAKHDGAKVAMLANAPSVIFWSTMIYFLAFGGVEVEGKAGFIVTSVVAIPLTTYVAYLSEGLGEKVQRQEYYENTVLGLKGYHWFWAVFPLYRYALGIVFVTMEFVKFQTAKWKDTSLFVTIISIIMLIPIVAWIYPLRIVYRVLTGELLISQNAAVRGIFNLSVLIVGVIVATGAQIGIYWILNKILN